MVNKVAKENKGFGSPKRSEAVATKNSKYNRVIVSFIDPARNYQVNEIQYPAIDDSGYSTADKHATMKSADGGFLLEGRFDFSMLTNKFQAQEMAEIIHNPVPWRLTELAFAHLTDLLTN